IFLFFEQFAKIDVSRDTLELILPALLRVISFDNLLADIAPTGHVIRTFAPFRIINDSSDRVANIVLAPFEIIDAILLDVDHRTNLHFRPRQNSADFAYGLRAESDASECNLLAGRGVTGAAENMPRDNRESSGGCSSGGNELPARN